MSQKIQAALADLDQMVAGLAETRLESIAACKEAGFETKYETPLTDGLIEVARGFLEQGELLQAQKAMRRVLASAELECDLIDLQADLHFLQLDNESGDP